MRINSKIAEKYVQGLATVIVPVFNREDILLESLESVFEQTYRPIELIIVDDGSTDKTFAVAKDWVEGKDLKDNFTAKLICKENAGPSAARNVGLSQAHGEYIQFHDSDDILHPSKIATQIGKLIFSNADFCVSDFAKFKRDLSTLEPVIRFSSRSHAIDNFPLSYPMNTPAPLYKRTALCRAGLWDESLRAGEDFEFNFRILCSGAKGVWIDEPLVFVRAHEGDERIQASPLKTRYDSMYMGLVKMELQAVRSGSYTKALRNSLALRALSYVSHMRKEGSHYEAMVFYCYAMGKLTIHSKVFYFIKKKVYEPVCNVVCPGGYTALKKRLFRGKR